jgi:hypothetical protein
MSQVATGAPTRTPGTPTRVRGWVTFADPSWNLFFVQDETGALYIPPEGGALNGAAFGSYVEVLGTGPDDKGLITKR